MCPNCHSKTDNFRGKNIEFSRSKSHLPASELFLSDEEIEERNLQRNLRRRKNTKKPREKKVCPVCNKVFFAKGKTSKFCSVECYKTHQQAIAKRPGFLELLRTFKEYKSFTKVAQKYGVTDNCIRK